MFHNTMESLIKVCLRVQLFVLVNISLSLLLLLPSLILGNQISTNKQKKKLHGQSQTLTMEDVFSFKNSL